MKIWQSPVFKAGRWCEASRTRKCGGPLMSEKIAIGGESFEEIRRSGSYYVDKTELVYELFGKRNNAMTLFTRPRRFGKTLNMSMLESFLSIQAGAGCYKAPRETEDDPVDPFHGLMIENHRNFCREYRNRFPVISVSFKDIEGLDFKTAFGMFQYTFSELYRNVLTQPILQSLDETDIRLAERMIAGEADPVEIRTALSSLMRMLMEFYHRRVILLIDEYDVPLAKAHENGYYREMLDLVRGIMSTSLKTNPYLHSSVVTGCLRIPKESIFTGVNNFASYSVMDMDFARYFGFTEEEVEDLLQAFGLKDKADLIRSWYDGYLFGDTKVYCPWDVMNYTAALLQDRNARPQNYWKNTSGNGAIRDFFSLAGVDVSDKFETLLNGGIIYQPVTDTLTYENAFSSENNLWSVLLMTGYVTLVQSGVTDVSEEKATDPAGLRLPNREIAGIFQETVVDHFNRTVNKSEIRRLLDALWKGDETASSDIMSDLLWHTISYMDYAEEYYHAFLAGIFVGQGYEVQSNRERGLGRPDIVLRDKPNRRAIVIEVKRSRRQEEMDRDCTEALQQIHRMEYSLNFDGYRQVLCYGIAFYRKTAKIKNRRQNDN